jgi:hypothetical protein
VYGARVNIEHYLSMFPNSDFGAMGDVVALSTEDIPKARWPGAPRFMPRSNHQSAWCR